MKNKNIAAALDEFLGTVQKPARYVGGELNIIEKDEAEIRIALSYPDLYDVGMANNGIKILYGIANSMDSVACERVFSVAPDFEEGLRARDIPLYTLETFTPLSDLDMVGFNLSHELLYSNILQILDLGKIPLLREERGDSDPVVIAGGEAVSNPFPVSDFIDVFFVGDGEQGFPEMIEILLRCRREGITDRNEIIKKIGAVEGVLLSSDYDFRSIDAEVGEDGPPVVRKRVSPGNAVYPEKPLVPSIRITQERAVVEVSRGCFNLCKFCHAGYYNLPYRACSCEDVSAEVFKQIDSTGYDEVTLTALSLSDDKHLVERINVLLPSLSERGISVSLPSLKVDKNTLPLIELLSALRKTSLTFAVESASGEIRSISNKKVKTDDLMDIVQFVFARGWKVIKLYFMIGLPGCDQVDEADEIITLLKQILQAAGKRKKDIHVTVSPFIPKPHTPFQWVKQMPMEYFNDTVLRIKQGLPRTVKVKNHDVQSSFLEGLFARADSSMGRVILESYREGARLDSWSEYFRFDIWMRNIEKYLPQWSRYQDIRDRDKKCPWQVIETGGEKAVDAMVERKLDLEKYRQPENRYAGELDREKFEEALEKFELKYPTVQVIRLEFSKTGRARFIPHIDLMEVVKRALRISGASLAFTQGFSKREKLAAGYPVPLGLESESELFDVDLYEMLDKDGMVKLGMDLNRVLPEGISLVSVREKEDKKALMALVNMTDYEVTFEDRTLLELAAVNIEGKPEFLKKGKTKERMVSFDESVQSYKFTDNILSVSLFTGTETSVRIDVLLSTVMERDFESTAGVRVVKKGQYELRGSGYEKL